MVDPVGLEPTTPALSRRCSNQLSYGSMICVMDRALQRLRSFVRGQPHTSSIRFDPKSGGMGIRTPDIQLAKLALYQLSYTP